MAISERQIELTKLLDEAARVYEQEDREIMSNFEYDKLYDELKSLESESGVVLANSPTVHAGYEILSELPKFKHENPCLSLDKTKNVDDLVSWIGNKKGVLSWKMDGLTVVLTYRDGSLFRAVTRGNGEVGEVITNNARVFKNIPLQIPFKGELVIRGEAVITYSNFELINSQILNPDDKYKNPRNLCSGSVRQLNNEITAKRNVFFFAFNMFSATNSDGSEFAFNLRSEQYEFLEKQGFTVVERKIVDSDNLAETVKWFSEKISTNDFPSDGLVLMFDDIAYGKSLGRTAKFPRDAIAFKWQDETAETVLREIEWSASRTGLINPVAIFDPVSLEGTTVLRASVHNVSVLEDLKLGIGDSILVYKANMIIPQIAENLTKSSNLVIPDTCPVCSGKAEVRTTAGARVLFCINPDCIAKKIKSFSLFVSRDAMNIDGMSEATIEKFIAKGFIHEYADFYRLDRYKDQIVSMEGFGEKSYNNIIESVNKTKNTLMPNFVYALGILNVGLSNAKLICRHFNYNWDEMISAEVETLSDIEGVGNVIAESFYNYFHNDTNLNMVKDCLTYLNLESEEIATDTAISGLTFVITGSVEHYANRNELKAFIESKGGKVASAVSNKTDYLINNDITSNSSKNKKARELNIPIISEEMFIEQFAKID